MAATVDELNASLQNALTSSVYQLGDQYTLTFTLKLGSSVTGGYLKIADDVYFIGQQSMFSGINVQPSNSNVSWAPSVTPVTEGGIKTTTVVTTSETNSMWFSLDQNGNSNTGKGLNNAVLTLSYDGADTMLKIDYSGAQYNKDLVNEFVWQNISFDAKNIEFMSSVNGSEFGSFTVTKAVPEPATGTLSLLALAGLCARRRRK